MSLLHARISHWAFWEDRDDRAVLKSGTAGHTEIPHTAIPIDNMTGANLARSLKLAWRRRLDLYGRAAAEVLDHTIRDGDNPHIVFASRHGNIDRTLKLLHQVATNETLSPADFSMSVHNALVGVASINWSITQSHTAISAGNDSLIAALTETLCQLTSEDGPVILCYVDLPLPDIYHDEDPDDISGTALAIRFDQPTKPDGKMFWFDPIPDHDPAPMPHRQARAIAACLGASSKTGLNLPGKSGGWAMQPHG
ncbi:Beta-ketoacyl synthase, N-terminal domain [Thalassospira xiamenensis M-5 = DSM 17429]|uniref:Beta-ketoacyl synthase-like N-terminal domain-containing protein n=1 Tax=Thalassospira xiamenensis M-5 = DSM 17429 TaxID=1123366 RepID=A0AB72UF86_9PROT|nr:beta-ketoacyl synthase chain length factor [Thalassospira xiamenensis]AJD52893.1 hypothetical protein TH3_13905 [Thalassospira xiamenensis M-5 = DSM 17429]SIT19042.1 Beta-ketoacyl synthase, N-terminal domain [Thalassospira xiamenensis M-5 = DSM 17429]